MDVAELRNAFSSRIRKLREERGHNQGQLANYVGISRRAMSYCEQEARTPDIGVLRAVCEKCGVSADYMIGLIPDQNQAVSDVSLETGLSPKSAKTLSLINRLQLPIPTITDANRPNGDELWFPKGATSLCQYASSRA